MNEQHHHIKTASRHEAKVPQKRLALRGTQTLLVFTVLCCSGSDSFAFRVFDLTDSHGLGVARWNAAPHFVDGVERSLDGGLRYSIEGGSYAAFRDQFAWVGADPSAAQFQAAVEHAFADWTVVDPESGLGTDLYFVPDFDTVPVLEVFDTNDLLKLNRGAEIDLFARSIPGAVAFVTAHVDPNATTATLSSGVVDYSAAVVSGFDIQMATDFAWSLSDFQAWLTKEIGQSLGLGNVDVNTNDPSSYPVLSKFYDDNFDNTNDSTALTTLTNSFANIIDPYDPDNSPGLMLYEPCSGISGCVSSPGIDTPGVNILMETSPQVHALVPQNDEFAGRQFLYPYVVPEPSSLMLASLAGCALLHRRRRI
jgi:hypothetical protein